MTVKMIFKIDSEKAGRIGFSGIGRIHAKGTLFHNKEIWCGVEFKGPGAIELAEQLKQKIKDEGLKARGACFLGKAAEIVIFD